MAADRIRARQLGPETVGIIGQELGNTAKAIITVCPVFTVRVELRSFKAASQLQGVTSFDPRHVVAELIGIEDVSIPVLSAGSTREVGQPGDQNHSHCTLAGDEFQSGSVGGWNLGFRLAGNQASPDYARTVVRC